MLTSRVPGPGLLKGDVLPVLGEGLPGQFGQASSAREVRGVVVVADGQLSGQREQPLGLLAKGTGQQGAAAAKALCSLDEGSADPGAKGEWQSCGVVS